MTAIYDNGWDARAGRGAMLLDPTVTNLNTGSFGPLPKIVFDRATELHLQLAQEPMHFLLRTVPELLWPAREGLAKFLHGDPRRLIFTTNVTTSINLVANGLTVTSPGEILLTDHEYGAMHWCWERTARRLGLTIRTFPLPTMAKHPDEIVAAAEAAMSNRTRVFFFSHVLSPTGLVLPARELCALARRRGILSVVDGAHAPAFVPIDLEAIGADFYGSNLHKWLLAPTGAGFLYLGPGNESRLPPAQVSWGWRFEPLHADERDEFGSTPRIRFYEFEGTRDICPWLAVPTAIAFQSALGFDAIRRRNAELVAIVRQRFGEQLGLPLATPTHPKLHGYMTAFRLPSRAQALRWRHLLWERDRIEVPIVERPDGLLIRLSTHFYNTEAEIEQLAQAVARLLLEGE